VRKKIYIALLFVFLLALTGCGTGKSDNKESGDITMKDNTLQNGDGTLTLEYVCSEFDIDEAEFEGVDFDAFVSYYGLTYDNIGEGNPRFLLNDYKALEDKTAVPDYGSIKATTNKFLPEYKDRTETVIIENVKGEQCRITIIDLKLGKIFSASGSLDNISSRDIVRDVDDTVKKSVADNMDKYNICDWVQENSGDEDVAGTQSGVTIIIKMDDDTVYGISCNQGHGNIENIERFAASLEDIAAQ